MQKMDIFVGLAVERSPPTLEFEYLLFMQNKNIIREIHTIIHLAVTKDEMQIQKAPYLKNRLRQRNVRFTKISAETPPIQRCLNQHPSSTHLG